MRSDPAGDLVNFLVEGDPSPTGGSSREIDEVAKSKVGGPPLLSLEEVLLKFG
jgi:hypothetical protein